MNQILVFLFATLAIAVAVPTPTISRIIQATNFENEKVEGTLSVLRVVSLIFLDTLIKPVIFWLLRKVFLPFRIMKHIASAPMRFATFVVSIPERVVRLPITIITSPVTFVLWIVRIIKALVSPITRFGAFIWRVVGFLAGVPTHVFGTVYFY